MSDAAQGDLITALVPLLKVRPVIQDFCRFGGSWESPHAPLGPARAQFHIVTRGSCILERPGQGELLLEAGDILLLPHGDNHVVRSRTRGVLRPITAEYRNGITAKSTGEDDADTELLCGELLFDAGEDSPLLAILPSVLVIRSADESVLERFRRLLTDIREELLSARLGSGAIAADFARALFVIMLRDHLSAEHSAEEGILSLLGDQVTARVALALLADPARDWTLDEMAEVAVTSRATLVRAFRKHGDTAPMAFLSDLRLTIARQRLAGTTASIAQIAADVGYQSESALSRAMLHKFGVRPGALRLAGPTSAHSTP